MAGKKLAEIVKSWYQKDKFFVFRDVAMIAGLAFVIMNSEGCHNSKTASKNLQTSQNSNVLPIHTDDINKDGHSEQYFELKDGSKYILGFDNAGHFTLTPYEISSSSQNSQVYSCGDNEKSYSINGVSVIGTDGKVTNFNQNVKESFVDISKDNCFKKYQGK